MMTKNKNKQSYIKPRLFVDMDGTLAQWRNIVIMVDCEEDSSAKRVIEKLDAVLYTKGYFETLAPHPEVVEAVRRIIDKGDIEVFAMSCVKPDKNGVSPKNEKNSWLDRYLPSIDAEHRILVPDGGNKASYVPGGITNSDFLLDDFSKNLREFSEIGRGIKLLNHVNSSHGTWQGPAISYDRPAREIAKAIENIVKGEMVIHSQPQKDRTPLDPDDVIDELTASL